MERFRALLNLDTLKSLAKQVGLGWGPQGLKLLAILVVGFALTRLLQRAARGLAHKLSLDRHLERAQLAESCAALTGCVPSVALVKILGAFGACATLYLAAELTGIAPLRALLAALLAFLPALLIACVMAIAGAVAASAARRVLVRALHKRPELAGVLPPMVSFAILGLTGVMVAEQLGVHVGLVKALALATLGASGIGLAGSLGLGGVPILEQLTAKFHATRHFELGDVLEVDGERGTLVRFGPTIALLERDGVRVMVPYARLLGAPVIRLASAAAEASLEEVETAQGARDPAR